MNARQNADISKAVEHSYGSKHERSDWCGVTLQPCLRPMAVILQAAFVDIISTKAGPYISG
jgi:hypothetical protein